MRGNEVFAGCLLAGEPAGKPLSKTQKMLGHLTMLGVCWVFAGGWDRPRSVHRGGTGWIVGDASHYDRDYAVDLVQLSGFLFATQEPLVEALGLNADGPT